MKRAITIILTVATSFIIAGCSTFTDISAVSDDTYLLTDSAAGPYKCKRMQNKLVCEDYSK